MQCPCICDIHVTGVLHCVGFLCLERLVTLNCLRSRVPDQPFGKKENSREQTLFLYKNIDPLGVGWEMGIRQ